MVWESIDPARIGLWASRKPYFMAVFSPFFPIFLAGPILGPISGAIFSSCFPRVGLEPAELHRIVCEFFVILFVPGSLHDDMKSWTRPKYPPNPYRETSVAIPLSNCVSCGIADYRCYTPTSFRKNGPSQSKARPNKGASQKKLDLEAYRAIGGVARNSIVNRAIVGH